MADTGWNQAALARELRVSPSTVTRAMRTRVASPSFIARAERLLSGDEQQHLEASATAPEELHILQKIYGLLVEMSGKVEALTAESRSGRGIGKGQQ